MIVQSLGDPNRSGERSVGINSPPQLKYDGIEADLEEFRYWIAKRKSFTLNEAKDNKFLTWSQRRIETVIKVLLDEGNISISLESQKRKLIYDVKAFENLSSYDRITGAQTACVSSESTKIKEAQGNIQ